MAFPSFSQLHLLLLLPSKKGKERKTHTNFRTLAAMACPLLLLLLLYLVHDGGRQVPLIGCCCTDPTPDFLLLLLSAADVVMHATRPYVASEQERRLERNEVFFFFFFICLPSFQRCWMAVLHPSPHPPQESNYTCRFAAINSNTFLRCVKRWKMFFKNNLFKTKKNSSRFSTLRRWNKKKIIDLSAHGDVRFWCRWSPTVNCESAHQSSLETGQPGRGRREREREEKRACKYWTRSLSLAALPFSPSSFHFSLLPPLLSVHVYTVI